MRNPFENAWVWLLVITLPGNLLCAQDKSEGIVSQKTGAHFIGEVFTAPPGRLIRIELQSVDSGNSYEILDSMFARQQTIAVVVDAEKADAAKQYPCALVLTYPLVKDGAYMVRYSVIDTSIVRNVILMQ